MTAYAAYAQQVLDRAGYSPDPTHQVWVRNSSASPAFGYSDGDEVEQRIARAISGSSDVSVFSEELEKHQTDWPSIYHLSAVRSNLLRSLTDMFAGARVLEIGAGCGAITRFIGEAGADVVALEGSARRASIAAARCRDLERVAVINESLDAFATTDRFDIVTLIGVLEYSRVYTPGADPIHETLSKARDLLTENGVLIVAIENQLGLKYFAGIPEDHLGRSMAGIQDEYNERSVVTFGKRELEERIHAAGFARTEFALPLPDYKLPHSVVLPAAENERTFDAASLAGQASRSDKQIKYTPLFSLNRAFGVIGRNGLLYDMANSFLVLAGRSEHSASFATVAPGVLAEQYSVERAAPFKKAAKFMLRGGLVEVERFRLCPDAVSNSRLLQQHITDEPYLSGLRWSEQLERIITRPGWTLAEVGAWLDTWAAALIPFIEGIDSTDDLRMDTPLPAGLLDAVPGNLIVHEGGKARFFDLEWGFVSPITFGYLTFRAIKLTLGGMLGVALPAEPRLLHVATLLSALLRHRGLVLTTVLVHSYLDTETALLAEVRQDLGPSLSIDDYQRDTLTLLPQVERVLAGHAEESARFVGAVADAETALADANERFAEAQRTLHLELERARKEEAANHGVSVDSVAAYDLWDAERARVTALLTQDRDEINRLIEENFAMQQHVRERDVELQRVLHSRSWKLTAPMRIAAWVARGVRGRTRRVLASSARSIYKAMPLSAAEKRTMKGMIFKIGAPVLSRTGAYQRWRAYEGTHGPSVSSRPGKGKPLSIYAEGNQPAENVLWQADGVREWADYDGVKQRIRTEIAGRRETRKPKPEKLLDFSGMSARDAAAKVRLPALPTKPAVTILVPVYNQLITTLECLASIAQTQSRFTSFEVLVANDASTDETAEILSGIPNLRVVTQPENLGFLRNCNGAAAEARGTYLLLLNNDVQVTEGWLDAMVKCIDNDASVGAVGPRIIYPSGWLQEAGTRIHRDGSAELVGLNDQPDLPRYSYTRDVDYCSGACLLVRREDFNRLGGFDLAYVPAYCEDSDLCMRLRAEDRRIVYCAEATVVHHLSRTSDTLPSDYKLSCIARNLDTFSSRWREDLDRMDSVRTIAFYLPQFHPIAENDVWWGPGFTEWTNVTKARPNFVGHYQPRLPADLGYYDLRVAEVMERQAELARRYGIGGFCFYYYWFAGHRLLERPIEQMLESGKPDFPFCLCWANENWTRRWDGQENEVLMAQKHSDDDDLAVIRDLMRYFRSPNYIRIDGKPLILIYRIALFPNFARTARIWRDVCREEGIGEIYIAQVESFELAASGVNPSDMGCDAAVEFPPQGMAKPIVVDSPSLNPDFQGAVADYRDIAVTYASRDLPAYKRFMGVMPGWDNTARRQNNSYTFQSSTPGAFQAWLEEAVDRTKEQFSGDERLVFINAWNEWAEGAYLEPDRRFGHTFLEAHANALDADYLVRANKYSLG